MSTSAVKKNNNKFYLVCHLLESKLEIIKKERILLFCNFLF